MNDVEDIQKFEPSDFMMFLEEVGFRISGIECELAKFFMFHTQKFGVNPDRKIAVEIMMRTTLLLIMASRKLCRADIDTAKELKIMQDRKNVMKLSKFSAGTVPAIIDDTVAMKKSRADFFTAAETLVKNSEALK